MSAAPVDRFGGRMRRPCGILPCLAATLALVACMPAAPIRPEAAVTVSEADLAIVESGWITSVARGGQPVWSPESYEHLRDIQLIPGAYTITYGSPHGESSPAAYRGDQIDLKPGHRYRAGLSVCGFWSPKHGCSFAWGMLYQSNCSVVFLWIEDATAGQVVAGSKTEPAAREGYGGLLSTCD